MISKYTFPQYEIFWNGQSDSYFNEDYWRKVKLHLFYINSLEILNNYCWWTDKPCLEAPFKTSDKKPKQWTETKIQNIPNSSDSKPPPVRQRKRKANLPNVSQNLKNLLLLIQNGDPCTSEGKPNPPEDSTKGDLKGGLSTLESWPTTRDGRP